MVPISCWRGLLGFGALIEVKPGHLRVKGIYVLPEERGAGVGTTMTEDLIKVARAAGAQEIEAIALNPAWYEARGFVRQKEIRPGSWRVLWEALRGETL